MRAFIEKTVDAIIARRKKLIKELASEIYAQKLRAQNSK
jgi:hypothetical protein